MRLSLLVALLAVAAGLFSLQWRNARPIQAIDLKEDGPPPRYALQGARMQEFGTDGRLRFEASADEILVFDDESLRMSAPQLSQLAGRQVWTLSSPSAFAPAGERRVLMQGPVSGEGQWPSGDRFQLRADYLWVDSLRREIYTDSEVSLDGERRHVQGRGLRADWSGASLRLDRDVVARYQARD